MELDEIQDWIEQVQKARAVVMASWKWQLAQLRQAEEMLRVLLFRASYDRREEEE